MLWTQQANHIQDESDRKTCHAIKLITFTSKSLSFAYLTIIIDATFSFCTVYSDLIYNLFVRGFINIQCGEKINFKSS